VAECANTLDFLRRPRHIARMFAPEHPAVELIPGRRDAGALFVCDHAANALPPETPCLGLPPREMARHIAWDIGAAGVTRALAAAFAAPAVLTRFSRLLIDANRGADDPTLVMRISDGALIPGNARIDAAEVRRRRDAYWRPYRDAIRDNVAAMSAAGPLPAIIAVHSFTPCWKGRPRPWQVALLWDADDRLARPLMAALRAQGLVVGDNEPYDGALPGDTLDEEVTAHGLAGALIEIRQDEIADAAGQAAWAARLADALRPILARPDAHARLFRPSRSGRHRDNGDSAA